MRIQPQTSQNNDRANTIEQTDTAEATEGWSNIIDNL